MLPQCYFVSLIVHSFVYACMFTAFCLHASDQWPEPEQIIPETTGNPKTLPSHKIYLGDSFSDGSAIRTVWNHLEWPKRTIKGTLERQGTDGNNRYIHYTPKLHAEGEDYFEWNATNVRGVNQTFSCKIYITPKDGGDDLQVFITDKQINEEVNASASPKAINLIFEENQRHVATLEIFDPDPLNNYLENDSLAPSVEIASLLEDEADDVDLPNFELQLVEEPMSSRLTETGNRNGWSWGYKLIYISGAPNYETFDKEHYSIALKIRDVLDDNEEIQYNVDIDLLDVYEAPILSSLNPNPDEDHDYEVLDELPSYPLRDQNMTPHTSFKFMLLEDEDTTIRVPIKIESVENKDLNIGYISDRVFNQDTGELDYPKLEEVYFSFGDEHVLLEEGLDKNYSKDLGAVYDGELIITFPVEDTFSRETRYDFYVRDDKSQGPVEHANGADAPFFTAFIEVLNDYEDDVSLEVFYPKSGNLIKLEDGLGSAAAPRSLGTFKENTSGLISDFNVIDPDSFPSADKRTDNNSDPTDGARILYTLQWIDDEDPDSYTQTNPLDVFEISDDGKLSFREIPNYEPLILANSNQFKFKVEVTDALQSSTDTHRKTFAEAYLFFTVTDVPEDPLFVDDTGTPVSVPEFSITLSEDTEWNWDMSEVDDNNVSLFLAAKDFDVQQTTKTDANWSVSMQSVLGVVTLNGNRNDFGKDLYIPDILKFQPKDNVTGEGSFELYFGNPDQKVTFNFNILNLPDQPKLSNLVNQKSSNGIEVIPLDQEKFSYDLNFSESDGLSYLIEFEDSEDNDPITLLEVVEIGDYNLFQVDEIPTAGISRKIEVSIPFLQDFENPKDRNFDGIYNLTFSVGDDNTAPVNYSFNFTLLDDNEPPQVEIAGMEVIPMSRGGYVTLATPYRVKEEQILAIPSISVSDPEGDASLEFRWSRVAENDHSFFELSQTSGNRVDLLFLEESIPSWENEDQLDFNITLKIRDTGGQTTFLALPMEIINTNDPPEFLGSEIFVSEPSHIIVEDLNDLVFDEDGHQIDFYLPFAEKNNALFNISGQSLVLRSGFSDFESKNEYELYLEASDGNLTTSTNLQVVIIDTPEVPEVHFLDTIDQEPTKTTRVDTATFTILEDEKFLLPPTLRFFDPDDTERDPSNLFFRTMGDYRGTLNIEANKSISYTPPLDYYSLPGENLSVDLNFSDGTDSSLITLNFFVEETPDPPAIDFQLDDEVSSFSLDDDTNSTLVMKEGFLKVANLLANDSKDKNPSENFLWKLGGRDANLFEIKYEQNSAGNKAVHLFWNLDELNGLPPDFGNPPGDISRPTPPLYDLTIKLYGGFFEDPDNYTEKNLEIYLSDRENEPPFFTNFEMASYTEESEDLFVGTVTAIDPDSLEEGASNDVRIRYEFDKRLGDYVYFQLNPAGSGKIYFKNKQDYEELYQNSSTRFQFEISAIEYNSTNLEVIKDPLTGEDSKTTQLIVVDVENKVETPFFKQIDNYADDSNFSIFEDELKTFIVNADTDDVSKDLSISLTQNDQSDNHLFELVSLSSPADLAISVGFQFKSPPDMESPRDRDKNNLYEIELLILTEDPNVFTTELFTIRVLDVESEFLLQGDGNFEINENTNFVSDLEVDDSENREIYLDLLFQTDRGTYYAPNSYEDPEKNDLFHTTDTYEIDSSEETKSFAVADFNNDGSLDVFSISSGQAYLHLNLGYGTFDSPMVFSDDFISSPRDVVSGDFDQDGHQDFIVSFHAEDLQENHGIYFYRNKGNGSFERDTILLGDKNFPSSIEVMDVDSDYDLDLLVVDQKNDSVVYLMNTGEGGFTTPLSIAEGFIEPRIVLPFNLNNEEKNRADNPYEKPDLFIADKKKVWLAKNNGAGEFILSEIAILSNPSSYIRDLVAVDLNKDTLPDLLFIDGAGQSLFFALQANSGSLFTSSSSHFIEGIDKSNLRTSSLALHYSDRDLSKEPVILVGTGTSPLGSPPIPAPTVFQFSYPASIGVAPLISFSPPRELSFTGVESGSISSMSVVDLDRAYNHFEFSIVKEQYEFELFDDAKFADNGRLFFKESPDYENPKVKTTDGKFRVLVSYKSATGTTTKTKLLVVGVNDVNELPQISQNHANWNHKENHLLVWNKLQVDNPESAYEDLLFTLEKPDSNDANLFQLDSNTGRLSFLNRWREEDNADRNGDGVYELRIRAREVSQDGSLGRFDEIQAKINLYGQFELPHGVLSNYSFELVEDELPLILSLEDFKVTDHPDNSNPGIFDISTSHFPSHGSTEINEQDGFFTYFPDSNFSGNDQLTLEFLNNDKLPFYLDLDLFVAPQPDPPVVRTPIEIKHSEGDLNVTLLKAYDSDPEDKNQLFWRLQNPEDENFQLVGKNNLYFRYKPDYELLKGKVLRADLIVSDGVHEVPHFLSVVVTNEPDEFPSSVLSETKANVFSMVEGNSKVVDLNLVDPDGLAEPTALVFGGPDNKFFKVENGNLMAKEEFPLSFESPQDSNRDNIYELKVKVLDGTLTTEHFVFVEILDTDENAPFFTTLSSNGERLSSTVWEAKENQLFAGTLTADDIEGADLSFSIIGGADQDLFVLNKKSGEIRFKDPPNYESNIDNSTTTTIEFPLELVISVTDGTFETTENLSIRITDVNDLPRLKNTSFSGFEDQILSANLNPIDEDGEESFITLVLKNNPIHGSVSLSQRNFSFSYQPDPNFFGVDSFTVSLTDDQNETTSVRIDLTIKEVNDPPLAQDDFYYYFFNESNFTEPLLLSVFENDGSGPDPDDEILGYRFELLGNDINGTLTPLGPLGQFSYLPEENASLGPEVFTYFLFDKDLNSSAVSTLWIANSPTVPNWIYLRNFGLFYQLEPNTRDTWSYHTRMGWIYMSDAEKIYQATWVWHDLIGWFWTGDWEADLSFSSWLYCDAIEKWLHWEGGINDKSGWFLRDYENNIYDEDFFIRLNIRNEIIDILPDLRGLSEYVQNNVYFKESEMINIVLELNRFGYSVTLEEILEYQFSR
jgi:hypothetical protein